MCKQQEGQSMESASRTQQAPAQDQQQQQEKEQHQEVQRQERRKVHFDPHLVIRSCIVEVDDMKECFAEDEEKEENWVHCTPEDLKLFRLEAARAVLDGRKLYNGDWKRLPCGGRGLEKFASREMAGQVQLLKLAVTNAVLGEQSRQRHGAWAREDYEDEDEDDTNALLERIAQVSQQHSRTSVRYALDMAKQDEAFVLQVRQQDEAKERKEAASRKNMTAKEEEETTLKNRDDTDEVSSNRSDATSTSSSGSSSPRQRRRRRRHYSLRSASSSHNNNNDATLTPPRRAKSLTLPKSNASKHKTKASKQNNNNSEATTTTRRFSLRRTTHRTTRALRRVMGKAAAVANWRVVGTSSQGAE